MSPSSVAGPDATTASAASVRSPRHRHTWPGRLITSIRPTCRLETVDSQTGKPERYCSWCWDQDRLLGFAVAVCLSKKATEPKPYASSSDISAIPIPLPLRLAAFPVVLPYRTHHTTSYHTTSSLASHAFALPFSTTSFGLLARSTRAVSPGSADSVARRGNEANATATPPVRCRICSRRL